MRRLREGLWKDLTKSHETATFKRYKPQMYDEKEVYRSIWSSTYAVGIRMEVCYFPDRDFVNYYLKGAEKTLRSTGCC